MDLKGKRIKVLVRRNLELSPGKRAAQSVHAVLGLAGLLSASPRELGMLANTTCVVLDASDRKFDRELEKQVDAGNTVHVFLDAGFTEVEKDTVTCMAFLELDPKGGQ